MDVQPGHCWRCEKVLPHHVVHCSICPLAVYCSTSCRDRDKARHGSVECQIFGPKKCGTCGKTAGNMSECAGCNNAWYCNRDCQRGDWETHKQSCRQVQKTIKSMSISLHDSNSSFARLTRVGDSPQYFGNTMAKDFLKFDNNEGSQKGQVQATELVRDYHVLSAGCGDLRNMVLTVGCLPTRYQGRLHVTLNDFDPFVMARNVLFLFMLVRFADIDDIASSLATIWYSLRISKKEYDLIKTSLGEIIQMSAQQLHDATKGLVNVLDEELTYLCQVWEGWQSLQCQRDKRTSINLKEQRKSKFAEGRVKEGVNIYLSHLSPEDKVFMTGWFDHALFLPDKSFKEAHLPFDNPTLTGREACKHTRMPQAKAPKDCTFVYCIDPASFPFAAWDCLRVRENTPTPCPSPMIMYHNYVTNLLQKVKSLILQGRLLIHISLANCLDFPRYHQALQMPNYDRIFTSNLADYLGFARLLHTFKPLLNATNPFSTIVTETMNWMQYTPAADIERLGCTPEFNQSGFAYFIDTHKVFNGYNCIREYYNNTSHFLQYLRADIMAGGLGIPPLKDAPSFINVKKYHGMQMRDFRKGINKLVSFQYRVNARDLTMVHGSNRAVEWCLPQSGEQ